LIFYRKAMIFLYSFSNRGLFSLGSYFRRRKNSVFLGKTGFFLLSIVVIIFLFFSKIITFKQV